MAKLEILEFPDPRLRTRARRVETFDAELGQLVDDMLETMRAASGIGLAATQVNRHIKLLVLDVSEEQDDPRVYINPKIVDEEGTETCEEGCLSIPGIYANVKRAEKIRVEAQDRNGVTFQEDVEGMHAVCLQHEMDHLEGKLFVDYLSPLKRQMVRKKLAKQRRQQESDQPVPARSVL
jgi:peptide deformylase